MGSATYSNIQPPFTLNFWEMSKKELKDYFKWFQEITPQRIKILADAVKASPGFHDWRPDYTPSSLNTLGAWLATQVEKRLRTPDEHDEIATLSPYRTQGEDWDLTNRTFSLAMDVGMYLSQVFMRNHPSLNWDQPFGSKKFIDYGQPVLVGFFAQNIPWNPVGVAVTLVYGLARKTKTEMALREIYDRGLQRIKENSSKQRPVDRI
jgi:hypothetical protein